MVVAALQLVAAATGAAAPSNGFRFASIHSIAKGNRIAAWCSPAQPAQPFGVSCRRAARRHRSAEGAADRWQISNPMRTRISVTPRQQPATTATTATQHRALGRAVRLCVGTMLPGQLSQGRLLGRGKRQLFDPDRHDGRPAACRRDPRGCAQCHYGCVNNSRAEIEAMADHDKVGGRTLPLVHPAFLNNCQGVAQSRSREHAPFPANTCTMPPAHQNDHDITPVRESRVPRLIAPRDMRHGCEAWLHTPHTYIHTTTLRWNLTDPPARCLATLWHHRACNARLQGSTLTRRTAASTLEALDEM